MSDAPHPSNLPLQATPFIGRGREIAEVLDLLRQPNVRLLTMTGPGGTGKTRLSLEVATQALPDYPDGAFFVALENITDPNLVILTVARILDVSADSGRTQLDVLKEHLASKQMLLVLDNFEQVIAAAAAIDELLKAAPKLKALTSSRVALQVYGEQEYPVPPLDLPDLKHLPELEELAHNQAIALFVQRAKAVKPSFTLAADNAAAVAEICVQLDGLPLAIELAAARTKLLTPAAIATRLSGQQGQSALQMLTGGPRNLHTRQQTLRNLIDWSYNLLEGSDRALFARLAVFMGGCTIEAAEAVCNADSGLDVLGGMESLVEKSLLRQTDGLDGESRFTMLTTIREYALDQLREREELDLMLAQHAEYFMKLVEQAAPELRGANQAAWLARLAADYDNIRATLGWLLAHQPDLAIQIAGQLGRFWEMRGYVIEGSQWLTSALQGEATDKKHLANALFWAGNLATLQGDYATANNYLEKALQLYRDLNDKLGIAITLNSIGNIAFWLGQYTAARINYEEYLAAARDLNAQFNIVSALINLGLVNITTGDYASARVFLEEGLQIARQLGFQSQIEFALLHLGRVAFENGDYDEARRLFEETRLVADELRDKRYIAYAAINLGITASAMGNHEKANELLEDSLHQEQELEDKWGYATALLAIGRVALAQKHYPNATLRFKQSIRLLHDIGSKEAVAETLINLGDTKAATATQATAHGAVKLISNGSALLNTIGAALPRSQVRLKEAALAACRAILTEEEYATAWAEGEAMTMEQAIDYALRED